MKRTIITVILTLALSAFAIQAVEHTAFSGAGIVESTTGGFKFPDGSIQLSATSPPCTEITYLPYIILDAGVYCLTGNLEIGLTEDFAAIDIQSDNVVLDLNGWMLDGLSAGPDTQMRGIHCWKRKNITIRNGTVRGFGVGVDVSEIPPYVESQGHVVEDIRAVNNTLYGIWVKGIGNIVRRNNVVSTAGGSHEFGGVYGIYAEGDGIRIIDNDISQTAASVGTDRASAIYILRANGVVVEGNRIDDVTSDGADSFGVVIDGSFPTSTSVLVVGNRISNVSANGSASGVSYNESSTGKYKDNLTHNVGTAFTGGTPVGVND